MAVIFSARHKTGAWDLEAVEMAVRPAMHHAGASTLTELLQFPVPAADQRALPCECGYQAFYREFRSKAVLTALGEVNVSRPYYLCPYCHCGQFPADVELRFRWEFFDMFNHPNFGFPGAAFGTPTFGQLTSASPGRKMQAGLKLVF